MKMSKAPLAVLLALAAVSGAKAEAPGESSEIYLVTIIGNARTQLFVSRVDGEHRSSVFKKRLKVPPGTHTVTVRTGALQSIDTNKLINGVAELSFSTKAGYTYTFWTQSDGGAFGANSKICAYEEPTNDPGARISVTREFRAPGDNSVEVQCAPMSFE